MMIWSESDIGGITVTVPDPATLLGDLDRRFATGVGFSVATLNLDHVVKLSRDARFREAYAAHTHVTADGRPIVWLSRLAGQQVELLPGSELIDPLAALAAKRQVPVALFGATQRSLETAARVLTARYPGLEIVLCRAPAMGFDPLGPGAEADIAAVAESGARLCFVALGAPKQELFVIRAAAKLPGTGFVSIGAGVDFISGAERRAPRWVRAIAAEWIWRLLSDPRRLAGRYWGCLLALPDLIGRALRSRHRERTSPW